MRSHEEEDAESQDSGWRSSWPRQGQEEAKRAPREAKRAKMRPK